MLVCAGALTTANQLLARQRFGERELLLLLLLTIYPEPRSQREVREVAPACPHSLRPSTRPASAPPRGAYGAGTGQRTPPLLLGLTRASLRTEKTPVEH